MLRSCSNPVFSRVLAVEYFFEEKQPLQFHVFDAEDGATSPSSDTFLGSTECTLGQVCIPAQCLHFLPHHPLEARERSSEASSGWSPPFHPWEMHLGQDA